MNLLRQRRAAIVTIAAAAFAAMTPVAAAAVEPSSAVVVDPVTVVQGQTFTVTQTIHNPQGFTVTGAKAAIYAKELGLAGIADLVSCTGTIAPCGALGSSYRGGVGDLPSLESRTVVFTLRIKDDAAPGQFTLQHQFVGDNFSFETFDGPVITVLPAVAEADLAVHLAGSSQGLLISTVTYTISVTNNGPADASGIRLTATYAHGLNYAGSTTGCARVAGTRTVNCDIAALPAGASAIARFTTQPGLLALGPFSTTAQRGQSTPTDPNPANDGATKTCHALTSLLVSC